MRSGKITKSRVDAALPSATRETFIWDTDLRGFGLRVYPSGKKTYFVQYRVGRRERRLKLGVHGPITPEQARQLAKKALGSLAHGQDPALSHVDDGASITVSELCDRYLLEGCATKRASTVISDRGRIERHIKPLLGRLGVSDVRRSDVERFLQEVAAGRTAGDLKTKPRGRSITTGGRGAATRTVGLLGGIFSFAQTRGLREDNPVRGVKRFPDGRLGRFLSSEEMRRLGEALQVSARQGENEWALSAIMLLALTGCRKSEVLTLRWSSVNLPSRCLILAESKTGHKVVPLGQPALDELMRLRHMATDEFVFPGREGRPFKGLQKVWERVRIRSGLADVRLHDLRHSFVSAGVQEGVGLTTMGKIVGHAATETTARYAHLARNAANDAADMVTAVIAKRLGTTS